MSDEPKTFLQTTVITMPVAEVTDLITKTVCAAVAEQMTNCSARCPLPQDVLDNAGHTFGMIKDLGDGSIERGVESVRHNHEFITEARSVLKRTVQKVYFSTVLALVSGVIAAVWIGFRHLAGKP